MADLSVSFCGKKFKNPFILTSAPPTTTGEMVARAFEAGWAGAVLKTVSPEPAVNVKNRFASIDYEDKRAMAFENIELTTDRPFRVWLKEVRELKKNYPEHIVIGSVMSTADDKKFWQSAVKKFQEAKADMVELNMSCPHGMPDMGMGAAVGNNPDMVSQVTSWVKAVAQIPVIVKMTPNITDVRLPARAAAKAGAEALSAINTVLGFGGVNLDTLDPLPNINGKTAFGGISGPAVKPIALRIIAEMAKDKQIGVPLSGIGGISTWRDAAEFILVGATVLQIGTAVMHYGYRIIQDLCEGLSDWMDEHEFKTIESFRGLILDKITTLEHLDREWKVKSHIDLTTCTRCELCYLACQDAGYQAIRLKDDKTPDVDEEKCVGCSLCSNICPVYNCVTMKPL